MFKDIKIQLMKMLRNKWVPLIVFVCIFIGLYLYSNDKYRITDRMSTGNDSVKPMDAKTVNSPLDVNANQPQHQTSNPSDLLPKDSNSQWASLNPIGSGNVAIPDLLESGHHIGIDTIGQSFKNPNYQNRPDPVIQKVSTGPWSQSSIEPDYGRASY